jgi:hypothetical protein
MLDKGRATIAGMNGEYHYACPVDQRFLHFVGISAAALKKQLATGKSDGEILQWILQHARSKPSDLEVEAWSEFQARRTPTDVESREFFNKLHRACGSKREDIATWFDLLDLDDFVGFGGKA